jgi:hypothetical protein
MHHQNALFRELEAVAVRHRGHRGDVAAVQPRAAARAEVFDQELGAAPQQPAMLPGNARIGHLQVALGAAPDDDRVAVDRAREPAPTGLDVDLPGNHGCEGKLSLRGR